MIIAEWKPLPEILEKLRPYQNILVAGCATCVAECAAGGEREVETMAPLIHLGLKALGLAVKVETKTIERQCEWEFVEELVEPVNGKDAVVSLACGIGVQALAERFPGLPIFPGVNTTALAIREQPGLWAARCAACGDCMLGETFGFCPVARCAKSLLNGPCGGTRPNGKCEVDENTDCIWNLIYTRAKERNAVEQLMKIRRPKDWSNSGHGGPKRMLREDHRP